MALNTRRVPYLLGRDKPSTKKATDISGSAIGEGRCSVRAAPACASAKAHVSARFASYDARYNRYVPLLMQSSNSAKVFRASSVSVIAESGSDLLGRRLIAHLPTSNKTQGREEKLRGRCHDTNLMPTVSSQPGGVPIGKKGNFLAFTQWCK